jgi:exosortase A
MNLSRRIAPLAADDVSSPPAHGRWLMAVLVLAAGLVALGALFWTEVASAVRTWEDSTAYNHCWLIAPIAAWLFWMRRDRLAVLSPVPTPAFALLALPGALVWLAAERLGIMEGRQLAVFGLAQVLVLTIFGWRFCRAFAAPLAYLVFLVPFGGFLVGPLQHITARLIDFGLDLVGITHYVDGLTIETPTGLFYVAEACAGLRFIVATLAFGALYALVIFRSPWRRLIVMALAIAVPIIANGIRAGGIIVLAEYLGNAQAAAADHIIYGWGFFSVVLLLLILVGLPVREDRIAADTKDDPPSRPAGAPRPATVAVAGVLGVLAAASGPAAARVLASHVPSPVEEAVPLAPLPGCEAQGAEMRCGELRLSAHMLTFSPQTTWTDVSAMYWRFRGGSDEAMNFTVPMRGGAWEGRQIDGSSVLLAVWLDGRPVGHGVTTRLRQALNSVGMGSGTPVLVAIRGTTPQTMSGSTARAALVAVIAAQGEALAAKAAERSKGN